MATQAELRAAMDCHKGKLRNLMEVMETALLADPFPKFSLRRKLGNAETSWNEVKNYYVHIRTMTDEDQAEIDRVTFEEFEFEEFDTSTYMDGLRMLSRNTESKKKLANRLVSR